MSGPRFRRLVLGLDQRTPDPGVRLAIDFAGLLKLDLVGLFMEDTELLGLAALPFAREISPLGGDWRPLEPARLARELQLEALRSERRLAGAVARLNLAWRFEVVRGPAGAAYGELTGSGDIVVLIEPASAAERITGPFRAMIQAAFRSPAAVLLVPQRLARRSGPVLAVAAAADDPSIAAGEAIAAAAGAELVILATDGITDSPQRPLPRGRVLRAGAVLSAHPAAVAAAFGTLSERLVVLTRGRLDEDVVAAIAAARAVPVLVVEPAD